MPITFVRETETTRRVNVRTKLKDGVNAALVTPLRYTGSPEELDREFRRHLRSYVDCHVRPASTLAHMKAEL